jgi:hypothetical protein
VFLALSISNTQAKGKKEVDKDRRSIIGTGCKIARAQKLAASRTYGRGSYWQSMFTALDKGVGSSHKANSMDRRRR